MSTPLHTTKNTSEPKADRNIRWAAAVTVILLAVSSGVLSYDALRTLAIDADVNPNLAFLFPITIDGSILSGSLLLLFFATKGQRSSYGLFLTALGVVASTAGNVAVSPTNISSQLVHAASPIVLFLSLEALTIILRWRSKIAGEAEKEAQINATSSHVSTENHPSRNSSEIDENATTEQKPDDSLPDLAPSRIHSQQLESVASSPVVRTPISYTDKYVAPLSQDTVENEEVVTRSSLRRDFELEPDDLVDPFLPEKNEKRLHNTIDHVYTTNTEPDTSPGVEVSSENTGNQNAQGTQKTAREQIIDLIVSNPSITVDAISDVVEGDRKYIRKLAREELAKRQ